MTQKYVDELEGEILKKDLEGNALKKDVQEDNIKSDFHDGHGWKSYQKYIILYVSIVLLSIGYLIFALQLKECQPLAQILESGLKSMINHH